MKGDHFPGICNFNINKVVLNLYIKFKSKMYHVTLKSKQQGEGGIENFKAIKNNP